MNILGISAYYHDSAAALVVDGEIVAAAQEERFTRIKHDPNFPEEAIAFCLRKAGIKVAEIDYFVFYDKPILKFDRLLETYLAFAPKGFASFSKAIPLWLKRKLFLKREIKKKLGKSFKGKLVFTSHHEAHAASAFFPSKFKDAAILTIDGVGEWTTASVGVGHDNEIKLVKELHFPHSLGLLYSAFTYYTGFKVNSGEYKLMGLAPYGKPIYADIIKDKLIDIHEDGSIWMDMSYFNYCQGLTMTSGKFHELFNALPRQPESDITQFEMDIAASIQDVTEEIVSKMAKYAKEISGCRNLCLAGGVALNCVANGKLLQSNIFDHIWIQPAAGDAGGALGCALFVNYQLLKRPRKVGKIDMQKGSLLGPDFSNSEIEEYLLGIKSKYEQFKDDDLLNQVSNYMADGKVIGWFNGKMEFGPRALGCRSILGDARNKEMQAKMNLKIKYRESFRPFAPCVLEEKVNDYFDLNDESPYMLIVAPVARSQRNEISGEEADTMHNDSDLMKRVNISRSSIPAVTHVDYSARVQTVDPQRHGLYYRLIKKFEEKTGCAVIINTSFNIRGEPIVCTPADAFNCFMNTEMDILVLGNFILKKTDQDSSTLNNKQDYQLKFELD